LGKRALIDDQERAVLLLLLLLPYVEAALTGVAPAIDDKRWDHLEYAGVAADVPDTPFPGVASVEALLVSFFALEIFCMPVFFDTLKGAKGWRIGIGSTSYCDNIARNVSSVTWEKAQHECWGCKSRGGSAAYIFDIAAVLRDKVFHFHLFDCLW
jgi:hypothetical protein